MSVFVGGVVEVEPALVHVLFACAEGCTLAEGIGAAEGILDVGQGTLVQQALDTIRQLFEDGFLLRTG